MLNIVGTMTFNNIGDVHIARQIMAIQSGTSLGFIKLFLETYVAVLKANAKSFIPGISRDDILNAIIPIPPYNEQLRICEQVKSIFNTIKGEN